jgi:hypothetical protein
VRGDREYEVIGDGTSLCILAGLFILFVAVGSKNGVFCYVLLMRHFLVWVLSLPISIKCPKCK